MSFSSNGIACFSSSKISVLNNETKVFHLTGALMAHFLEVKFSKGFDKLT